MTIILFTILSIACGANNLSAKDCKKELTSFISSYESRVSPLYTQVTSSAFKAKISGNEADYKRSSALQVELAELYSNKDDYKRLNELSSCPEIKNDPYLARQLQLILNLYTPNQIDKKQLANMIELQTNIENKFSTFRAKVDGKDYTDNQIEDILSSSTNSKEVEKAWIASKLIGTKVAKDIKDLVTLRNKAARDLGFKNYHQMMLKLNEQDPQKIEKLFDSLDTLTKSSYIKVKRDIDKALAKKFGIKEKELMPWHYQNRFFQ